MPSIEFKFVEADHESVDDETQVFIDGVKSEYSIQHSSGKFIVNELADDEKSIMELSKHSTLRAAKSYIMKMTDTNLRDNF